MASMMINPHEPINVVAVNATARGADGFGSTGV